MGPQREKSGRTRSWCCSGRILQAAVRDGETTAALEAEDLGVKSDDGDARSGIVQMPRRDRPQKHILQL